MNNYIEFLNEKRPLTIVFLASFLLCDLILIIISLFIKPDTLIITLFFNVFILLISLTLIKDILSVKKEKETVKNIINSIKNEKSILKKGVIHEIEKNRISRRTLISGEYNLKVEDFYYYGKNFKIADSDNESLDRFGSIMLFNYIYS
tara:strand:- start:11316 stop:11759 length:444 start_codon:yes stop_codon:yes gene_type:complete